MDTFIINNYAKAINGYFESKSGFVFALKPNNRFGIDFFKKKCGLINLFDMVFRYTYRNIH